MVVLLLLRKSLSTNNKMKETKIALGTWAWGAGADTLLQLPLVTNLFNSYFYYLCQKIQPRFKP